MIPFAAVLLAGGRSQRMGRDKALLPLAGGRLLWQRQLKILQDLEPTETFISGPARAGFPRGVAVLADEMPGLGPLAGIATALTAMRSPLLLVLAIDMPRMTTAYLAALLRVCADGEGAVPRHPGSGFYEPLAAVYPRGCLPLALARLQTQDRSLQRFVREAEGLITDKTILSEDEPLFTNWNDPLVE